MEFKVGDDVVVVLKSFINGTRRIVRRHKVEKVYKTGHVIINGTERYRQNGSDVSGSAFFTLHHWSQELQDESDETYRIRNVMFKCSQFVKKLDTENDFEVIDKVMKLIPEEVFNLLEVRK